MILLIYEKKISPVIASKQTKICNKINVRFISKLFNKKIGIKIDICENNNEPINPEIVLLGLILDNFGPLIIFPNT